MKKDGFTSYSEDSFDAFDVIRHAKENIVIMANSGGNFLEKYESVLKSYMKKGIDIYYLVQSFEGCAYMDKYLTGKDTIDFRQFLGGLRVMKNLVSLDKEEYKGKFIVRYMDSFFTASYITADIDLKECKKGYDEKTSVIHVMLYQYGKQTSHSPIFHIDAKSGEQYLGTLESMRSLWKSAHDADSGWLDEYVRKIEDAQKNGYPGYEIEFKMNKKQHS